MTTRHIIIICLFAAGSGLTIAGLIRFFLLDKVRQAAATTARASAPSDSQHSRWTVWAVLLLVVALGFLLRIEGTELRGMTHVEVYIPGIQLPENISEPPPRIGLMETLAWQWHGDPHPPGYFYSMWPWTKLFGTEIGTLRLPSVLLGTASVILVFLLAARLFGTWTGLASAALLALNGHQIYWSQMARPYILATFLGLLSTYLLTGLLQQTRRQRLKEIAYIAVTWMGVFTQIFFWPFLAGQMLYTAWYARRKNTETPRILKLQSIVAMLGAPLWAHAVYNSREIILGYPTLEFLQQFLTFAFLFQHDFLSIPERDISPYIVAPLTITALLLLIMALRNSNASLPLAPRLEDNSVRPLVPIAVGMCLVVLALATLSWRRQVPMSLAAIVPFLALLAVPLAGKPLQGIQAFIRRLAGEQPFMTNGVALMFMCSLVPTLLLFLIALKRPLIMDRGFLLLTPYVIVLLALGLRQIAPRRLLFLPLAAALLAAHGYSIYFYRSMPHANDYRATAQQIIANLEPGDIVFVHNKSWVTTPLFYHLQGHHDRLVATDYLQALQQHPDARVWLPLYSDQVPTAEMERALACLEKVDVYTAHRSRLVLFARPPGSAVLPAGCPPGSGY